MSSLHVGHVVALYCELILPWPSASLSCAHFPRDPAQDKRLGDFLNQKITSVAVQAAGQVE